MEKCKYAQKNRKFTALLILLFLTAVISMINFPVWGNEKDAKPKKNYTAESNLKLYDYITSVLYDRQIADKYRFYSTDMFMEFGHHSGDIDMFENDEQEEAGYQELKDFTAGLTQGASDDEEKLRRIYTWIVENIYYDRDVYDGRSNDRHVGVYDVFKTRRTVCEGYASLLRFMLLSQKIPAVYISGDAYGAHNIWESHAWVMAYVNDRWVNLEPTWDSGNKYENGKFKEKKDTWEYYECSNEVMSEKHSISTVNGYHFDNIHKTGLFYENGKYFYYVDGKISTETVKGRDVGANEQVLIQVHEADGSIPYFDTEETIIEFKDKNLLQALLDADADWNGDGKISIHEARTYFYPYSFMMCGFDRFTIKQRGYRDKLDLSGKKIRDLTGLNYFIDNIDHKTIKMLDLSNNEISDLSPLNVVRPNKDGLQYINLSHNQISDLSPLEYTFGTNRLARSWNLSYNQVSDLSTIPDAKIVWLDLSHNQVSDVSTMPDDSKVEELSLAYNQISDLSGAEKLKNLDDLNLSYNQISDPSPIVGIERTLDIGYNQIKDRKLIDELEERTSAALYIKGNPFWAEDLKLNKKNASLKVNKSIQLKARLDSKATVQEVEWKSSNPKVATVSSDGKVTAKKKGSAVITCCTIDGSGLKARCKIKVK